MTTPTDTAGFSERFAESLKNCDRNGDLAPPHVHDPLTQLMRERAVQAHYIRFDGARGHYVLTQTGRQYIAAHQRQDQHRTDPAKAELQSSPSGKLTRLDPISPDTEKRDLSGVIPEPMGLILPFKPKA